jgi:sulfur carrier protein
VSETCTVNGRAHPLEPGETVARLLERLDLAGRYALVERNGEPVDRSAYPDVELERGDVVIVARPVAGG